MLVVACPCSLGLAAPLAGALAIGQAAQRGLLIRSGGVLERLTQLKGVAFDKTGTLTQASFERRLEMRGRERNAGVAPRGRAGSGSDHPVARAVLRLARERGSRSKRRARSRRMPAPA